MNEGNRNIQKYNYNKEYLEPIGTLHNSKCQTDYIFKIRNIFKNNIYENKYNNIEKCKDVIVAYICG